MEDNEEEKLKITVSVITNLACSELSLTRRQHSKDRPSR